MVLSVAPETVEVPPAGLETTVYEVIGSPPLLAGAVQVTVAEPFPGDAVAVPGTPGVVAGVTAFDGAPALCAPFCATTVNT